MDKKPKKTSVTKDSKNIEFCLGDAYQVWEARAAEAAEQAPVEETAEAPAQLAADAPTEAAQAPAEAAE